MVPLLVLAFVVVPLVELFVILQVGQAVGAWNTVGLLLLMSVVGAWLMKREGMGVLRRIQRVVQAGGVPGREMADGALILFGGALMLTPGFISDLFGMALLLPPVRAVIRPFLLRRFVTVSLGRRGGGRPGRGRPDVIDL